MSAAIEAAKAKANATTYMAKYGPDETYWPHFLDAREATADDYLEAFALIEAHQPEATIFLDHLRTMAQIKSNRDYEDEAGRWDSQPTSR